MTLWRIASRWTALADSASLWQDHTHYHVRAGARRSTDADANPIVGFVLRGVSLRICLVLGFVVFLIGRVDRRSTETTGLELGFVRSHVFCVVLFCLTLVLRGEPRCVLLCRALVLSP